MSKTTIFVSLFLITALPAVGNTFSFQGSFFTDDQVQLFPFTVASNAGVVFKSLAYGGGVNSVPIAISAGGFDTFFSLFAGDGSQINTNDDGTCAQVHSGNSGCLDAYLAENLTAGAYTLALTQSGNTPNGDLADGFAQEGQGNYTCPQGFCDVFGSQQNGKWAIEMDDITTATRAPEPTTFVLGGVGCPTGQVALSGACGYSTFDAGITTMRVAYSGVDTDHRSWRCSFYNTDTVKRTITYGVFCAPATAAQIASPSATSQATLPTGAALLP